MRIESDREQPAGQLRLTLDPRDQELLRLVLLRATFEDTPPEQQREILDFASALLEALKGQG